MSDSPSIPSFTADDVQLLRQLAREVKTGPRRDETQKRSIALTNLAERIATMVEAE